MNQRQQVNNVQHTILKNRPKDSKLSQQKLPAWQPILTTTSVIPIILATSILFIPIGIILIVSHSSVKEWQRYYPSCNNSNACITDIMFELTEDFTGDVYFYYGLENYYQNNRRYMKSRSDAQLLGDLSLDATRECSPYDTLNDTNGNPIVIAPCGTIANSMFNDTFQLFYNISGQEIPVPWTYSDIIWSVDKDVKFKNPSSSGNLCEAFKGTSKPPNWQSQLCELDTLNPDNNGFLNSDFIVWMRTAALPNFRKPYRKLSPQVPFFFNGLKKGLYRLSIENNYPVDNFSGKKSFIISTTSLFGGKNNFLGIAYTVVGSICVILSVAFIFIHVKYGYRLSEMDMTGIDR